MLHTTEGGWTGSMSVFHRHYAPHFILGKDNEDKSKVHIAQLVPIGNIGSSCRAHNNLAHRSDRGYWVFEGRSMASR